MLTARLRVLPLLAVVVLALAIGRSASAQDDDEKEKKRKKVLAGRLLREGDIAMKRGDYETRRKRPERAKQQYERALKAYEKAFELYPLAQIYFPIGLAEQKLGRNLDAMRHYQQLLDEVDKLKPALKAELDKRVAEVRKLVVVLKLTIKPDGSTVTVDGNEVGTSPLVAPVFLNPGEHTVAVTAHDHIPYEKKETFEAGEVERPITLEKTPVVVAKPKPKPKPKKKVASGPSKQKLYIGIGATAGMATIAIITGLVALSKHGTFTDDSVSQGMRDSAQSSGKTFALVSDLFWLGTIAAGAYTAYYYYKVYQPKKRSMERRYEGERESRVRDLWVAPYVAADSGGVAAGGRF